jgi:glycosyltransferase involved in cell wall biosynthesis
MLYSALSKSGHYIHCITTEKLPIKDPRVVQHILRCPFSDRENIIFWAYFISTCFFYSLYIAKTYKICRIVTFGAFYSCLCCLPIIAYKIPIVTFLRTDNLMHSTNRVRNLFFYYVDWMGIKLSSLVLTVTPSLKESYRKRYRISERKMEVIQNNIVTKLELSETERKALRTSLGVGDSEFLLCAAGAFNRIKNFSLVIKSLKHLTDYPIKLLLVGDEVAPTGEKSRLYNLVETLCLRDRVIFSGWRQDIKPFIACSDLFVLPSRIEGSPNVLLEALGCGVPCLGSRIPEVAEILAEDELLFSIADEAELVSKLKKIFSDAGYYKRIGELSSACSQKFFFDWNKKVTECIISLDCSSSQIIWKN